MSSLGASPVDFNPSQPAPTSLQQVQQSLQQQIENGKEFLKRLTTKQVTPEELRLYKEENEYQNSLKGIQGLGHRPTNSFWKDPFGINGMLNRVDVTLREFDANKEALGAAPQAALDTMSLARKALMIFLGLVVVLLIAWIVFKSVSVNQRNRYLNRN